MSGKSTQKQTKQPKQPKQPKQAKQGKQTKQKRTTKTKSKQISRFVRNTRKQGKKNFDDSLLNILKPTEEDVYKMLAGQVHIGRRKSHANMNRYVWKRRSDGVHIINLEKTWHKLVLAARILVTIKDPSSIAVMSSRTVGQRGAIKFAHYTGAKAMVGKWVPGTFTNPQNKAFSEPRLLIVDDPMTCFAALKETSYIGIPVIALCGCHNNTRFVDCAIPCNNRGKFSLGLMFWLLAREILRMRGTVKRTEPWEASVDLFFYRDADEIAKQQKKAATGKTEHVETLYEEHEVEQYEFSQRSWDQEPPNVKLEDWGEQQGIPEQKIQDETQFEQNYDQYDNQQNYEQFDNQPNMNTMQNW